MSKLIIDVALQKKEKLPNDYTETMLYQTLMLLHMMHVSVMMAIDISNLMTFVLTSVYED